MSKAYPSNLTQDQFESSRGCIPRRSAAKLGDCNPNLAFGSKTFSIPRPLAAGSVDYLNDLIPEAKPGGRPRSVEMWEVLNAIFYLLVEGCRWLALPGDFPAWQTVYTYFRN